MHTQSHSHTHINIILVYIYSEQDSVGTLDSPIVCFIDFLWVLSLCLCVCFTCANDVATATPKHSFMCVLGQWLPVFIKNLPAQRIRTQRDSRTLIFSGFQSAQQITANPICVWKDPGRRRRHGITREFRRDDDGGSRKGVSVKTNARTTPETRKTVELLARRRTNEY